MIKHAGGVYLSYNVTGNRDGGLLAEMLNLIDI